jgi:hypothetical protein
MSNLHAQLLKRKVVTASSTGGGGGTIGTGLDITIEPEPQTRHQTPSYSDDDDDERESVYNSPYRIPNPSWSVNRPLRVPNADDDDASSTTSRRRNKKRGRNNQEPEIELPIKRPCSYRDTDDLKNAKEEETDDPHYCYLCDVTLTLQQLQYDLLHKQLFQIVNNCIHEVDKLTFCRQIQEFYNAFLRKRTRHVKKDPVTGQPLRDENGDIITFCPDKVWTCFMIYEHFFKHAPSSHMTSERTLRILNDTIDCLAENGIFERDPTEPNAKIELNQSKTLLFLRILKEQKQIAAMTAKYRESVPKIEIR